MTTFTIHTDDYLADAIRTSAASTGRSINVFLKGIITSALGVSGAIQKKPTFLNVPKRISKTSSKELLSVQSSFSTIDEDLWK